jgi:hypothetical protein
MEKICQTNMGDLLSEEFIVAEIIQFLDIKTLFTKLMLLNHKIKKSIEDENYLLFQKYRDFLNVPTTFDTSDVPYKKDISKLFK